MEIDLSDEEPKPEEVVVVNLEDIPMATPDFRCTDYVFDVEQFAGSHGNLSMTYKVWVIQINKVYIITDLENNDKEYATHQANVGDVCNSSNGEDQFQDQYDNCSNTNKSNTDSHQTLDEESNLENSSLSVKTTNREPLGEKNDQQSYKKREYFN